MPGGPGPAAGAGTWPDPTATGTDPLGVNETKAIVKTGPRPVSFDSHEMSTHGHAMLSPVGCGQRSRPEENSKAARGGVVRAPIRLHERDTDVYTLENFLNRPHRPLSFGALL